ncbi:MAG TPA: hypothetical protein VML19_08385 [Verrucomicrobiae bacterium]|nr:hypothetical protein [Verrucomicrobiae bacterium]
MYEPLTIAMRWLHITSMATLVGGMIFGRLGMSAALRDVSAETRESIFDKAATFYRPLVITAICGSILSGIYKFLLTTGHSVTYHTLFGIKMLLVLHVYAAAILAVQPHNRRRARLMLSVAISGVIIILISAWLSRIF